jgi:hypothetical protein
MSRKPAIGLTGALLYAIAACTHTGSGDDFGFGGPKDDSAIISVENQYFGEMIIYILEGAVRTRVGTVGALSSATLTVPDALVGMNVQLQASPLSPGVGFTSQHLLIAPGSTVALRLASELPLSNVSVR